MVSWEELENACQHCRACPLAETRTNVVFGVGSRQADILFIGEGPGEQEDLQGEPFVGPAGKLLDLMLSLIDLERSNVYIANIVKCRPPKTGTLSTPSRTPALGICGPKPLCSGLRSSSA